MAIETWAGLGSAPKAPDLEKTPSTRLLDMLAGWSRYAQHDTENGIKDVPYMERLIEDLYQKAAETDFGRDSSGDDVTRRDLEEFLVREVLPALLYKSPGTRG